MKFRPPAFYYSINLAQQFLLGCLVILILSMIGMGWWIGKQIENGVINRTAGETALYVDSFIDPPLQELDAGARLNANHEKALDALLNNSPLGQHIVAFKVWGLDGRIIYSTNPKLIGNIFSIKDELRSAIRGEVVADISDLKDAENLLERGKWNRLLETYAPITRNGTNHVIGVVEFYQTVDTLDAETRKAQLSTWGLLGGLTLLIYLLLSVFVNRASRTIDNQRAELKAKVAALTELLAKNEELDERVRGAASRYSAVQERMLRRISAELHDGPAQDLGYTLLRLDSIRSRFEKNRRFEENRDHEDSLASSQELEEIEEILRHSLKEIRAMASGMGLPDLEQLTLPETLQRAVHGHERRTTTQVAVELGALPVQASLSIKMTIFRLIQETLNNSYRHAKGIGQAVRAYLTDGKFCVEVSDQGMGFDLSHSVDQDVHLGLSGLRERVESLGGLFRVESTPGQGTIISAQLPISVEDGDYGRSQETYSDRYR